MSGAHLGPRKAQHSMPLGSQLGIHRGHWLQARSLNFAPVAWQGPLQDQALNVECLLASLCSPSPPGSRWPSPHSDSTEKHTVGREGQEWHCRHRAPFCRWSQGPHGLQICLAAGWRGPAPWGLLDKQLLLEGTGPAGTALESRTFGQHLGERHQELGRGLVWGGVPAVGLVRG